MANQLNMDSRRYGVDRRSFLRYLSAVSAIPLISLRSEASASSYTKFKTNPFTLGVASGDPSSDGVVLWTRLAPDPLNGGGMPNTSVLVRWEVAGQEDFSDVVRSGVSVAPVQLGHSVHVEVDGLDADRWYFYRFHVGDETSPVGRTRTAPDVNAMPDRMKFAFTSCQHYEHGYFNGYPHMQQEDLDLIIHLGDYIYEGAGRDGQLRKHIGGELNSLADYRNRHSQYRLDQSLQETHRQFPWLVTWDDHEFDNNYANLVSEEDGVSPEEFLVRRMNAYQAYYEFMPLRRSAFPQGPHMTLYRACRFGRLVNFHVLDTRQYRSDQPNGDGLKPMEGKVFDQHATILGDRQESWVMGSLAGSTSVWNALAQQVMMAPVNRGDGGQDKYKMDQWPGYDVSRRRLLNFFHSRTGLNPVILTGDIHVNWVNDLRLDFTDSTSPVVATELVGTSMCSGGNGGNIIPEFERAAANNEFVRWYDSNRGYVSCEVTPQNWTARFRATPFVDKPGSPVFTAGTFLIEAGRAGVHSV
ncbi:MAG: alkaline phosphatase D family protein [Fuerstiella sp.]|nr:alkaline phosphatase D family protein [Fuerstiella sp.]